MSTSARVIVIGGGIAGCSTLYHLTQEGIADALLLERDELTSGTTWHSAAQVTNFGPTQTMIGLKSYSIKLYKELADDPDYPINYHHGTGGLRLASTEDHLDGYHHFASLAKGMGVDFEVLDAEECARRHPLIATHDLRGALWDPLDGDIDPAQLCQALARRARKAGARVKRFTPVTGLTQTPDDHWIVHTPEEDYTCEVIVNAGGYRCNEIAAMMGGELPVASMEHQYLLTEPIGDIAALDFRVPLIRCPTDDFYSRQEKDGLLVGFYEQDCRTWGLDGISRDFTMALCPDDLDRVIDVMAGAFARLPCLQTAGIHSIVNGPITYTPDGLPLVGPIAGKRNAYCITGLRAGLGEGGGHGWLLAQIIAHGEACYDTWCIDPRRFTRHADVAHTAKKAVEDYQNEFRFHMPHEHRPAGRNVRTTPLYDRLAGLGAAFATVNRWERAEYFKPSPDFEERHAFRFNNAFDVVKAEVEAVHSTAGIMEVSGFTRYAITGKGALDWLDGLSCSRLKRRDGRVSLAYFLNRDGNVKAEATIAPLDAETVWWGSAAAAEDHDRDWLGQFLPDDGSIRIENLTEAFTILVLAGPRARAILAAAAPDGDWSAENFPWLSARWMTIGSANVLAMTVSYSGELAFELHVPNKSLVEVFDRVWQCGQPHGIRPFGLRAAESMRLEKGYRHWKADLITEFDPFESELERFVDMGKDFIGKDTLVAQGNHRPRRRFVTVEVDSDRAPAHPGEAFMVDGVPVGTVTAAGWGHRTARNIAMGFVDPAHADIGGRLGISMLGHIVPATVCQPVLYDPENRKVRQ